MNARFRPAGHLIYESQDQPPTGNPGTGYDYILAANGIFVRSESPLLRATVLHTGAAVRGLAPMQPELTLKHGPVPRGILSHILLAMRRAAPNELFAAVAWEEDTARYQLRIPPQETSAGHVQYDHVPNAVLELHSHGNGNAFFSGTDDRDEQGFALYGVAGNLNRHIRLAFRIGVYGHFQPVTASRIFALPEHHT